jgi:hypothetical protein
MVNVNCRDGMALPELVQQNDRIDAAGERDGNPLNGRSLP